MERMVLDQIRKKFPDEWVLLIDPDTDEVLQIRSGIVAAHSPKRKDIYDKLQHYKERRAIYFTGEIGKDKVFAL